jgi:hypothetical protein
MFFNRKENQMQELEYGSTMYNDLKSSLPDDVFAKKFKIIYPKKKVNNSGLGGKTLNGAVAAKNTTPQNRLDAAMKAERERRNMFSGNGSGSMSLKKIFANAFKK